MQAYLLEFVRLEEAINLSRLIRITRALSLVNKLDNLILEI